MASYSVLIVEDHPELGRMLGASLKTLGQDFEIVNVPSGEEALLVANSQPIDLLLTDYLLPGLDGLELISKLKARQPSIKSILITGSTSNEVRKIVANAEADAFFFKPVAFADLLDAVRKTLSLGPAGETEEGEPEPPFEEADEDSDELISDHLSQMRRELEALSVVLVDDRGQNLIQAGDVPDGMNADAMMPALMAVLSAGGKVSLTLGKSRPGNLYAFPGLHYDVYMAPVGPSYALVIITAKAEVPGDRGQALSVIFKEVQGLPALLERMGISLEEEIAGPTVDESEPEFEDEGSAEDIDALFEQSEPIELSKEEVDAFWDISEKGMDTGSLSADDLSYDQAQKLGLTPDDIPTEEENPTQE